MESEDEIKELNHKLKVKMYEVEQLKEDMTIKENMLVKGEFGKFIYYTKIISFISFAENYEGKGKYSDGEIEFIERG